MTSERNKLVHELNRLLDDNNFTEKGAKQRRGREFEQLIKSLLTLEGLQPRGSFRPDGEEIDGSFVFGQSVYLYEAKWHNGRMPASSIYQFKGKVDGKLIGTIGIYISMSGFSSEAVDALTYGKSINVILFDRDDFRECVALDNGFQQVLMLKLRAAVEDTVFFPVRSVQVSSTAATTGETTTSPAFSAEEDGPRFDIIFVVEGRTDERIVQLLAERIMQENRVVKRIKISVAGGKFAVARLAGAIQDFSHEEEKMVVIADADRDREETYQMLQRQFEGGDVTILVPDPEIETWLTQPNASTAQEVRQLIKQFPGARDEIIQQLIAGINMAELTARDADFAVLYKVLVD